jgi:anti-anti-sigma factor
MRYNFERTPTTPPGAGGVQPGALSIMIDKRIRPACLAVAGDIDVATCDCLVDAVYDAMTGDVHALDIDVSGVTFCGSAGISAFLRVRRRAQEQAIALRLVNLSSYVERVLTVTGLLDHLTTPPQDLTSRRSTKPVDPSSRRPDGALERGGMGGP